jgi:putative membrane protein
MPKYCKVSNRSESVVVNEKTLIICIDGDNDIGEKCNIKTPIWGREKILTAATQLAVTDPEEADANAMFGAINLYDRLVKQHPSELFEVSSIAGSLEGGVKADRKMINELTEILSEFNATNVILVTDGFSDQELIPIIQSRIPITSIHHVVVKHSDRIEESWAVFFKYLRMLIDDPYYSRVSLGVPGIILVLLGFLIASNQMENAGMMVAFVLGIALFIKGFGIDTRIAKLRLRLPPQERQLSVASKGFGVILVIIGVYQGAINALKYIPSPVAPFWELSFWVGNFPSLTGAFLSRGSDLIIGGIAIALIGGGASHYLRKSNRMWQNMIGLIFLFWMRFILLEVAKILIAP